MDGVSQGQRRRRRFAVGNAALAKTLEAFTLRTVSDQGLCHLATHLPYTGYWLQMNSM